MGIAIATALLADGISLYGMDQQEKATNAYNQLAGQQYKQETAESKRQFNLDYGLQQQKFTQDQVDKAMSLVNSQPALRDHFIALKSGKV